VSKTYPFGRGIYVVVGKTTTDLHMPSEGHAGQPVLARGSGPGPSVHFQNGKPLTRVRFVDQIREALTEVGVDSKPYSGHSFCSGAATTRVKVGMQDYFYFKAQTDS